MKKWILVLLSTLSLSLSAKANEVIEVDGEKLVLLSTNTIDGIVKTLAGSTSADEKALTIRSLLAVESKVIEGQESFCATAGKIYQENLDEQRAIAKCQKALASHEINEGIAKDRPQFKDPTELRKSLSIYAVVLMNFPF